MAGLKREVSVVVGDLRIVSVYQLMRRRGRDGKVQERRGESGGDGRERDDIP